MYKISICTVSMNRLHHLRETLCANILDNIGYWKLEFILLDYNSEDGLEDWVKSKMMPYVERGILKYYRTYDPTYFSITHAKNMAAGLATGDILCMINADNYTGANYAHWVNKVFQENGQKSIITTIKDTHIPFRDQGGKQAFCKDDFVAVRGFDESCKGYGMDDIDIALRLEHAGGERVFIESPEYLRCIKHSHTDRLSNGFLMKNIKNIYLQASLQNYRQDCMRIIGASTAKVPILYVLHDGSFLEVYYEFDASRPTDQLLTFGGWQIAAGDCKKGTYQEMPNGLLLSYENETALFYNREDENLISFESYERNMWKNVPVAEEETFTLLGMAFSECHNRLKFRNNIQKRAVINEGGWGEGTVYLNFNTARPVRCTIGPARPVPAEPPAPVLSY